MRFKLFPFPCRLLTLALFMLFIFLLDNDELMNEIKFPVVNSALNSDNFYPTSIDASIYFIQQYSKVQQKENFSLMSLSLSSFIYSSFTIISLLLETSMKILVKGKRIKVPVQNIDLFFLLLMKLNNFNCDTLGKILIQCYKRN